MKRILLCVILFVALSVRPAFASEFTKASFRFDHIEANSNLSGLVCATPSSPSNGTEARLRLTFPSDFTLNTTLSNWTTSSANIPAGNTPWPGITTNPLSISGQDVTFGSGDLTSNTNYCFTLTASSSKTGSTGNKTGYITSLTSGNTIIDQTEYGIVLSNNDQVTVNGTVSADTSDFFATLVQTTSGNTFPQNATVEYILTYYNYLPYPTDLTVEAEWDLGTIQGENNPSVDVFSYVNGSASNGYSNTSPVIDTPNRTIRWTIPAFPGNSSGQVTFKLLMSGIYTASNPVAFAVRGRVVSLNTQSLDSIIKGTYLYNYSSPQSTAISPTATPTSSVSMQSLTIDNINIRSIASTAASIQLTTSLPSSYLIRYGASKTSLDKSLQSSLEKENQTITLTDLLPGKKYFFTITVTDDSERTMTSDMYTFTTSTATSPVLLPSLLVASKNIILLDQYLGELYIPTSIPAIVQLKPLSPDAVSDLSVIFYKGSRVYDVSSNSFMESPNKSYSGEIFMPDTEGIYDAYARITDYSGNITETKIMTVYALHPLLVRDLRTHMPIEHARILLSQKNNAEIFSIMPSISDLPNPSYTNSQGLFTGVLMPGTYEVTVTAIGYEDKTVRFSIENDGYPIIDLKPLPFSLMTQIIEHITMLSLLFSSVQILLQQLALSNSYFFWLSDLGFLILAWITLLSLAKKLRVSLPLLPWYLFIGLPLTLLPHKKSRIIEGVVLNARTKKPVKAAHVRVIDFSNHIIAHAITNAEGRFFMNIPLSFAERITVMKKGFLIYTSSCRGNLGNLKIALSPTESNISVVKSILTIFTTELGHFLFEGFLLLSVGVIFLYGKTFGTQSVLPLIISTGICGIYWILHLLHRRQQQIVSEVEDMKFNS